MNCTGLMQGLGACDSTVPTHTTSRASSNEDKGSMVTRSVTTRTTTTTTTDETDDKKRRDDDRETEGESGRCRGGVRTFISHAGSAT